MSQALQA